MAGAVSLLQKRLDRRLLLAGGLAAAGGTAIAASSVHGETAHQGHGAAPAAAGGSEPLPAHGAHGAMITVGEVDDRRNGFDPAKLLSDWDTGSVSTLPDGRTLRTFEIVAEDKEVEIAPGIFFPA